MSGGSYRYASIKGRLEEAIELVDEYKSMADDMREKGYGELADQVEELFKYIKNAKADYHDKHKQLIRPMKAFEWWMSGDYSRRSFEKKLHDWRTSDVSKSYQGSFKFPLESIRGTKWEDKDIGDTIDVHKPHGTIEAEIVRIILDHETDMIEYEWIYEG